MLAEIHCDKFAQTPVILNPGFNVVVGDSAATNSIGKSTFLMVIDFLLGGDTFIEHNSDVIDELGHHKYFAKFYFDNDIHTFCRETGNPTMVFNCKEDYQIGEPINVREYRDFLSHAYGTDNLGKTFRSAVSPFCRIWGKDNLSPKRPLDAHKNTTALYALDLVLHLYKRHEPLVVLEQELAKVSAEKSALQKAQAQNLIPKLTAAQFKENARDAEAIDKEITEIKNELQKYAVNLRQIASRDVREVKEAKDQLLESRAHLESRLRRINASLGNNSYIKSKSFEALKEYFPQMDTNKLARVEEFHSEISGILRKELRASKRNVQENLERIDSELAILDERLDSLLTNLDSPGQIVDRVHLLAKKRHIIERENDFRERSVALSKKVNQHKKDLNDERKKQLSVIQITINDEIEALSLDIYGKNRKSPYVSFGETNYTYEIFEDTGTGRAYANLVLFDLAVLRTSKIPTLIHDSLLFKNVENEAVAHMVNVYDTVDRQVFIAIDEVDKYGTIAVETISKNTVLSLSDAKVLYVKDWRKKTDSNKAIDSDKK